MKRQTGIAMRGVSCLAVLLFASALDVPACADPVRLFSNNNVEAVASGPAAPTTFRLDGPAMIARITTYHWNGGRGTVIPGTIALRASTGEIHGPWPASGQSGQGGVPNTYWIVHPNVTLEAGEYSILVSDPGSWSQNGASGNAGMGWIDGYPQ